MAEAGGFLIPVSELRELFSCTAHTYDDTILVMEKAGRRASIAIGEREMTLFRTSEDGQGEEKISLNAPLTVRQGQLFVRLPAPSATRRTGMPNSPSFPLPPRIRKKRSFPDLMITGLWGERLQ